MLAEPTRGPWPGIPEHKSLCWQNQGCPPSSLLLLPLLSLSQPPLGLANTGCQMGAGTRILWLSGLVHPSSVVGGLSSDSARGLARAWLSGVKTEVLRWAGIRGTRGEGRGCVCVCVRVGVGGRHSAQTRTDSVAVVMSQLRALSFPELLSRAYSHTDSKWWPRGRTPGTYP